MAVWERAVAEAVVVSGPETLAPWTDFAQSLNIIIDQLRSVYPFVGGPEVLLSRTIYRLLLLLICRALFQVTKIRL